MRELLVDFITSLDGYASGEGWPGWWGLQGPEYLSWLDEQPEVTYLMGANTYRGLFVCQGVLRVVWGGWGWGVVGWVGVREWLGRRAGVAGCEPVALAS